MNPPCHYGMPPDHVPIGYSYDSNEGQYPVDVTNNEFGFNTSNDTTGRFERVFGTAYDWNISSNALFNVDSNTMGGHGTFMLPRQPLMSPPSAMDNLESSYYVNDSLNTFSSRPPREQALNNVFSTIPTPRDPQVPEYHTTNANTSTNTSQSLTSPATPSQAITASSSQAPTEVLSPTTPIGLVLLNGTYLCTDAACEGRTYGRYTELKRHHAGSHALDKPTFWCDADGSCPRSEAKGNKPFLRNDKLRSHMRNMHRES